MKTTTSEKNTNRGDNHQPARQTMKPTGSLAPAGWGQRVGAFMAGKGPCVTITNTLGRSVVVCLSMDPNTIQVAKVNLGMGGGAGAVIQANLGFDYQAKVRGPVQKQGLAPGQKTTLQLDGKKAYLTALAKSSTGGYYVIMENRLVSSLDEIYLLPKHMQQVVKKVKGI